METQTAKLSSDVQGKQDAIHHATQHDKGVWRKKCDATETSHARELYRLDAAHRNGGSEQLRANCTKDTFGMVEKLHSGALKIMEAQKDALISSCFHRKADIVAGRRELVSQ